MSCSKEDNGCGTPVKVPRKTKKIKCERQCFTIGENVKLKMLFTDSCALPVAGYGRRCGGADGCAGAGKGACFRHVDGRRHCAIAGHPPRPPAAERHAGDDAPGLCRAGQAG